METTETPISQDKDSNEPIQNNENQNNTLGLFAANWKLNIVDNYDAPELYSRKAIYIFTVFCSVLFGGALMFVNLGKMKNTKGQINVVIYSVLYLLVSIFIQIQFERNTIVSLFFNVLGSFMLYNYFWAKYIGAQTQYKPISVTIPVIAAIVFVMLLIAFRLYGGN